MDLVLARSIHWASSVQYRDFNDGAEIVAKWYANINALSLSPEPPTDYAKGNSPSPTQLFYVERVSFLALSFVLGRLSLILCDVMRL